jgi:hypothetical protein
MGQLTLSEKFEVLVNRGAALEISYKVLGRCRLSGHLVYGTLTMTECYYPLAHAARRGEPTKQA